MEIQPIYKETNKEASILKKLYYSIPLILTSSLTFPLTRLKILYQTSDLIIKSSSSNEKIPIVNIMNRIYNEQRIFGFFRGNLCQIYKILIGSFITINTITFINDVSDALNIKINEKYRKIIITSSAAFLSGIVIYPFDLCLTRMSADMSYYDTGRIYNSVIDCIRKSILYETHNQNGIRRLYKGIIPYSISHILYNSVLLNMILNEHSLISIYFSSFLLTTCLYPLDTYKRIIQLNSISIKAYEDFGVGFFIRKGISFWYKGFILQIIKTAAYPFILYFSTMYVNQSINIKYYL